MKLKGIITTLALSLTLGLGVGVGLAAQEKPTETKADGDLYYLKGDFNSWSDDPANCLLFSYHNASEVKLLGFEITGNCSFKVLKQTGGVGALSQISDYSSISGRDGLNAYTTGDGYGGTKCGIHYNNDDFNPYVFNLYFNFSSKSMYVDKAYKLNDSIWMEGYGDNEVTATFTPSAGDSVSITSFDKSSATINPTNQAANNLRFEEKTVKVGGEPVSIFYNRNNGATWLSGYGPETDEEGKLQNFCNAILADTISDGVCNVSAWESIQAQWNSNIKNNSTLLNEFNGATITWGASAAHANVVAEARSRYARLNGEHHVTLDNATLPSSGRVTAVAEASQNFDHTTAVIIIAAAAFALAATGCFFFMRKKEDR